MAARKSRPKAIAYANQNGTHQNGAALPVRAHLMATESLEPPDVILRFKKSPPYEIEVDFDALTWDDFMTLQTQGAKLSEEESQEKVNEVLSRICGQDVRKLPGRVVGTVLTRLKEMAGPEKNSG
jgi:hypothetical protein